jgi:2-(1,2-epoxy-1,2-dihydrophenyl)acetyl-CoA isomerase
MSTTENLATDTVRYALDNGVATITLNRPESLNSMNDDLMMGLSSALACVANDEDVRVVILTGAGRGFCSGADLNNAAQPSPDDPGTAGVDLFNPAIRALASCPVPTVARINGVAAGGGFGLALVCDIAIARRSSFFVATFGPRLGIVPDLGATWSLPRIVGRARALGIAMLGERIEAEQAEEWGLIWKAVDDDQLDIEVAQAVETLRRTSPAAMTRIRSAIDGAPQHTLSDQLDVEMEHQAVLIPRNMAEGAQAFLEKREPKFSPDRG